MSYSITLTKNKNNVIDAHKLLKSNVKTAIWFFVKHVKNNFTMPSDTVNI